MLRRYSSRGVETLNIESRRTIGKQNCDIIVEGNGVASPHAAIELHPFTRTYWLRELSLTGSTTVNGRQINGQTELHSGDLIRLGNAQPLIFEEGSIFPVRKISSEMSNKSYEPHLGILPVLGQRMESHQSSHRLLNGSRNSSAQRVSRPKRSAHPSNFRDRRLHATAVTPNSYDSSPASIDSNSEVSPRLPTNGVLGSAASVGNNLLQRVVRLQTEVSKKDEEILSLLHRLRTFEEQFLPKNGEMFQEPIKRPSPPILMPPTFELEAYRSFINIISQKLHKFNEIVLSYPHKDYADVFLKFSRSLEEPFSLKMMEIEEECRKQMQEKGFDEIQLSRLRPFLTDDHKEHISNLAHELEVGFPVIRDATSIARESISVCSVFTQWSRQLGDNLRTQGLKSSLLHHAIDSLKEQFAQSEMSRHWLPPSVAPLFRLIALEAEKKESNKEEHRSEKEATEDERLRVTRSVETHSFTTNKIDQLITEAEEKTVQLQGDIDSLSDSMKHQLDLDKATEAHLESLCTVLATIKESLQRFTEEHDKTYRKRSILSVEINQQDLEEGIVRHQANVLNEFSDKKKDYNETGQGSDFAMWEEAFEGLRAKIFHLVGVDLRPAPEKVEYVVVRKHLLTDLIYASIRMYEKLKGEDEEAGNEVAREETIEERRAEHLPETEGHERPEQVPDDSSNAEDQKRSEIEELEETEGTVHAPVSFLVHTKDGRTKEHSVEQPHKEEEKQSSETEEHQKEHTKTHDSELDDQSLNSQDSHPNEDENHKMEHKDTHRIKREASGDDDVVLTDSVQKLSIVGEKEEPADNSPRTSVTSLGVISSEEYMKHEEEIVSPRTENVPLITEEGPSPIERQTSQLGSGLSILRPRSARPRTSQEPKLANGSVKKKIPPALSLDKKSEAFEIPIHPLEEKKEWSEGTDEEISLSETLGATPTLDQTMTLEEKHLFETRKRVSLALADSLLNGAKPKSICDVTYNAHIQSHINTATRTPNSYSKVPVSPFNLFNSPPSQKKKVRIEEKPPLRQPRMQFKL